MRGRTSAADGRGTVVDAGREIVRLLERGDSAAATQVLLQVVTNLRAVPAHTAIAMTHEVPQGVDPRWEAALAGIIEWVLGARGLPAPAWTSSVVGVPNERWDPWTSGAAVIDFGDVPEPLRRPGVYVTGGELGSV